MSRLLLQKLILIFALLPPLVGGSPLHGGEDESVTAAVKSRGKLTMLCFPTLAGGVSPNLAHGPTRRVGTSEHFSGFEIWLMEKFAQRLEVELEIRTLPEPGFGLLIPAMLAGKADLVASTLSITSERKNIVDFSLPYNYTYQVVVSRAGSGMRSTADLKGKIPVVAKGTSHHHHLRDLGFRDKDIHFVEFVGEYFTAVSAGDADFALSDAFEPDYLEALEDPYENPLEVAFALPEVDQIATALPKGSDLKEHLDALIRSLDADGSLAEARDRFRKEPEKNN